MLTVIKSNEAEKWNDIIKKFKHYDVYYQLEYAKAFQIHGDGEPILFYYKDEYCEAINVAMLRDISEDKNFVNKIKENTYFDLVTPYGYGGFLIEGEINKKSISNLNHKYVAICEKMGIVSEFCRFHPVTRNSEKLKGIYDITELGKTVTMNLTTKEQIWEEITGKNRNVIRKAIKSGVSIYWGRDDELFEKFIDLYEDTMDYDEAEEYYYFNKEFYYSVLNDLKYNSLIFYAVYEGEIIAMSIILFSNHQLHYHLSASKFKFRRFAPTNLLLYEAATWGSENKFTTFHLGGGLGSKEDNLYKFKKSFNKNSNTHFSIGKKIFNEDMYNYLVSLRENEVNELTNFFPLYRA